MTELPNLGQRTLIMGVLNVTPDSFSDGGLHATVDAAVDGGLRMIDDGADILDIGGESTRPATFHDNQPLDTAEEMARVIPVIQALRAKNPAIPISIDTYKADVATAALDAGATIINDISGLTFDAVESGGNLHPSATVPFASQRQLDTPLPRGTSELGEEPGVWVPMASLAVARACPVILMHILGSPRDIPSKPQYVDVVQSIIEFFNRQIDIARAAGIDDANIILDPGIGFGKTAEHNLEILRRLPEIVRMGYPVLVGASRKRFIGKVLGVDNPRDRVEGTAATVALSIAAGASIVRVHDVKEMARVARMSDAVVRGWREEECP